MPSIQKPFTLACHFFIIFLISVLFNSTLFAQDLSTIISGSDATQTKEQTLEQASTESVETSPEELVVESQPEINVAELIEKSSPAERALLQGEINNAQLDREIFSTKVNVQLTEWQKIIKNAEVVAQSADGLSLQQVSRTMGQLDTLYDEVNEKKELIQKKIKNIIELTDRISVVDASLIDYENFVRKDIYEQDRLFYQDQVNLLLPIEAQSTELQKNLSERIRQSLYSQITRKELLLLSPIAYFDSFIEDFKRESAGLKVAFNEYKTQPKNSFRYLFVFGSLTLLGLLFYAYVCIKKRIKKGDDKQDNNETPSYSRRILLGLINGIGKGLIPVSIIWIAFGVLFPGVLDTNNSFVIFARSIAVVASLYIILLTVNNAMFSPEKPRWRLTQLSQHSSRRHAHGLSLFGMIFCADLVFRDFLIQNTTSTSFSTIAVIHFIFLVPYIIILLFNAQKANWQPAKALQSDEAPYLHWRLIRITSVVTAVIAILLILIGYIHFASYLVTSVILSSFAIGLAYMILLVLREVLKQPVVHWLRSKLHLRIITIQRVLFWATSCIDILVAFFTFIALLYIWGVPFYDIKTGVASIYSGVKIGGLTLSIKGILSSILLFMVIIWFTRLIKRVLLDKILPNSAMDRGTQHSVATIFGYFGWILALTLGFIALGIDFKNIAIIAGALSVGIGFGLQNIVSNFISGLILLFERPIKVGDWVIVGEHEGIVQNVTFRSTEIKTFKKSSVLIPNADLISQPVTNVTFADKLGRIEIQIGLPYSVDVDKVRATLLDIAEHHKDVLNDPEPQIVFMNFNQDRLDFEIRCFTSDVGLSIIIASDLRFEIFKRFKIEGISLPLPRRIIESPKDSPPPIV